MLLAQKFSKMASEVALTPVGPFTNLSFNPSMEINRMSTKMLDEITYQFLNVNGATVEV